MLVFPSGCSRVMSLTATSPLYGREPVVLAAAFALFGVRIGVERVGAACSCSASSWPSGLVAPVGRGAATAGAVISVAVRHHAHRSRRARGGGGWALGPAALGLLAARARHRDDGRPFALAGGALVASPSSIARTSPRRSPWPPSPSCRAPPTTAVEGRGDRRSRRRRADARALALACPAAAFRGMVSTRFPPASGRHLPVPPSPDQLDGFLQRVTELDSLLGRSPSPCRSSSARGSSWSCWPRSPSSRPPSSRTAAATTRRARCVVARPRGRGRRDPAAGDPATGLDAPRLGQLLHARRPAGVRGRALAGALAGRGAHHGRAARRGAARGARLPGLHARPYAELALRPSGASGTPSPSKHGAASSTSADGPRRRDRRDRADRRSETEPGDRLFVGPRTSRRTPFATPGLPQVPDLVPATTSSNGPVRRQRQGSSGRRSRERRRRPPHRHLDSVGGADTRPPMPVTRRPPGCSPPGSVR